RRPRWPSGKVWALGRRAPVSKPDPTEDPPRMGPVARRIIHSDQTPSRWCGAEVWRERCQFWCRPRHLTEGHPKIALVLLQKRDVNITKLNFYRTGYNPNYAEMIDNLKFNVKSVLEYM
ncbi:hypothetical protein AVEN_224428-1, partial [Araneus ventricosus]